MKNKIVTFINRENLLKRGEKVIIENKKGKGIEGDRGRKDGSGILLVSLIR